MDSLDTLPWSTDLSFQTAQYSISHSTLTLRHWGAKGDPSYEIVFTGVVRMELDTGYSGLTITPTRQRDDFDDTHYRPLLLLELRDRKGRRGFVACHRVGLDQVGVVGPRNENRFRLSSSSAGSSEFAVGGEPMPEERA